MPVCVDLPAQPVSAAESLRQTAVRVVLASGASVEPSSRARGLNELTDGYLVLALDGLDAAVAACDGVPPDINRQKRMLAAVVAADIRGRLAEVETMAEKLRVGAKLYTQAKVLRAVAIDGERQKRIEASAAAAEDAALAAVLPALLAVSDAAGRTPVNAFRAWQAGGSVQSCRQ